MTNTQSYLDMLKTSNGGISDGKAAKILGVSRSAVSLWRNEKGSMSLSHAEKLAENLGIDPDVVILDTYLDRAKSPDERAFFERILNRIHARSLLSIAALCLFFAQFTIPEAYATDTTPVLTSEFVLCKIHERQLFNCFTVFPVVDASLRLPKNGAGRCDLPGRKISADSWLPPVRQ